MSLRAPTLGGNFAVWGGLFSTYECGLRHIRRKQDPFNSVTAGFLTGGTLAARAGLKAAGKNAMVGGILLGLIEGLGHVAGKLMGGGGGEAPMMPRPLGAEPTNALDIIFTSTAGKYEEQAKKQRVTLRPEDRLMGLIGNVWTGRDLRQLTEDVSRAPLPATNSL
jgi:hypothetical protein